MDYKALAEILFPDVTMTPDEVEAKFAKRDLPEGAVVTRMAPSPDLYTVMQILGYDRTVERINAAIADLT